LSRTRGKYEVVFAVPEMTLGFNLAWGDGGGAPVVSFEASPARAEQAIARADITRGIDNLDAGMGYSRRIEDVPNGYAYCYPGHTRSPGTIFMPAGKVTEIALPSSGWTAAQIWDSQFFDGSIYLITAATSVLKLAPGGQSATVDATFAPPFEGTAGRVFNNHLYVAGGAGGLAHRPAGGAWAIAAGVQRRYLATTSWRPLGVPTQMLLGLSYDFNASGLRWCPITADPTVDANWSAPVPIGTDRRYAAGPIVAAPRRAYVYQRDGIYDLDELGTRAYNIAPWIAESEDIGNGWYLAMSLGTGVYYSHIQGLAYVETSGEAQYRPEWAQPGWGLPYEGAVRGRATAIALHDGWGLLALADGQPRIPGTGFPGDVQQSYIVAGRRAPSGQQAYGPSSHIWHGAEAIVPGAITHQRVYGEPWPGASPHLFMGTDLLGVIHGYWQSLPRIGSPLQELIWGGPFVPADTSQLFLPADPYNRPSAVKQLLELELVADRLQLGSDYLKVYAAADGAAWVEQGTAEADVYSSLLPSEALAGRYLSSRVDGYGQAVLRSLDLRVAMGIQLREARTYRLILAWDNALRGARGRETADPERRMLELRALLGRICTLDDGEPGGPYRVLVLQVQSGERRRLGGAARAGAGGTEGAWAIVVSVTVSFLDRPFSWDSSTTVDRFDADRTWA
jgi:hypothetical protein